MTRARLGLVLAAPDPAPDGWRDLPATYRALDDAGADAIWVTDHLFWHTPTVDVFAALTLLATGTTRATVGTAVVQLPLHQPAGVAKAVATAQALAPGRVILGVGAGEHEGEFEAAGRADVFHRRGRVLDEGIDEVRRCWAADGRYRLDPPGSAPIWIGGRSAAARRRAATRGDGWMPHLCRPDWYERQQPLLDEDLAAAARPADAVRRSVLVAASVMTDGDPGGAADGAAWLGRLYRAEPRIMARVLLAGSARQVADGLRRFTAAGATEVNVLLTTDRPLEPFGALRDAFDD